MAEQIAGRDGTIEWRAGVHEELAEELLIPSLSPISVYGGSESMALKT